MLKLQGYFKGRRSLSTGLLTLSLLLLVIVPLWIALSAVLEHRDDMAGWIRSLQTAGIPEAPQWLHELPVVGSRIAVRWNDIARSGSDELVRTVSPYLESLLGWIVSQIGSAGLLLVHFLLTVIFAAVLFMRGEVFGRGVMRFATRLGGQRGAQVTILAAQAVRAVAMGVVLTALLQAVLASIAFLIVGIPYPILLATVIFMLAVIQIGAGPVLIPLLVWLYWNGQMLWGTVFLVFSMLIMGVDNIVRPFLIQRGANLPLLLIFTGVVGGLISFGIIGLFIGPIILAVSYTLLRAWVDELPEEAQKECHSTP
ncbi:MAG: AI-2E family transporter YdiK [Bdellovibrionota bacterium]|nr:MAG: AI-2E family transporter YdiK [Bdellovibrionota bacterium]